jgi:hypothetical protein
MLLEITGLKLCQKKCIQNKMNAKFLKTMEFGLKMLKN